MLKVSNLKKKYTIKIWCTIACIFHLYTAAFGILPPFKQRSIHLLLILPLVFIIFPNKNKIKYAKLLDIILIILSIITIFYVTLNAESLDKRIIYLDKVTLIQLIFGTILIALVLEATRRAVSSSMSIFATIFIIYVFLSPYLPGILHHRPINFSRFIEVNYLFQDTGIFGMLTGISATYIFIFVLLASIISGMGIGKLFTDISYKVAGRSKGGPAKVAVISSALFGSISGVATANVYATGSFTIPMMKKLGYDPIFAGATEAAASTGGLLMPPIMGVGAFVIAELTGTPYLDVCKASILPAILYYFGIFVSVHSISINSNLKSLEIKDIPSTNEIKNNLYLLIPIFVLIYCLIIKYTAFKAAFYAIIVAVIIDVLKNRNKFNFHKLIDVFEMATRNAIMVSIACCCAGIIVAIIGYTGIGVAFSNNVLSMSRGILVLALFFVMLSSIILGMGLPCTVAYIIAISVGGPILLSLGVYNLLHAHLFVYYFAILAAITPPVCMASYAAASIANVNPLKVGFKGMKLAFVGFIVPYIFIRQSSLLFEGPIFRIILDFIFYSLVFYLFSVAFNGYWQHKVNFVTRIFLLLSMSYIVFIENIFLTKIFVLVLSLIILCGGDIISMVRLRVDSKKR